MPHDTETEETLAEYQKRRKRAIKLLCDCDFTPIAATNIAGPLCSLKAFSIARQRQVISAVTKIVRGEGRVVEKSTPVSLGRRPKGI
ncbi:hypothetical protein LCGC14_1962760 [marine sediment metagenome]|uniref:Uncharacterized protein n=1 Tax=marine sediment metagenome TaxID=412755 RepID=A0A0F9FE12_9ZZZZ